MLRDPRKPLTAVSRPTRRVAGGAMTPPRFETTTLSQQIRNHLIELILSGELRPGQWLRMEALRAKYGFTPTPLREAMSHLASSGLLEHSANRGYRVCDLQPDEMTHLIQVREALEGLAARLMAVHATDAQLARLAELAAECDRLSPPGAEPMGNLNAELAFHEFLAEACGNKLVPRLLLVPNVLLRSLIGPIELPDRGVRPDHSHAALAAAVASRDPARAEAMLRVHLQPWEAVPALLVAERDAAAQ